MAEPNYGRAERAFTNVVATELRTRREAAGLDPTGLAMKVREHDPALRWTPMIINRVENGNRRLTFYEATVLTDLGLLPSWPKNARTPQ